jgi:hypothetical protein
MQESVPARSNGRSTLFSLIAMGIFDDAIRQHLDLKRQRGATESELKQLEDEAFGPPSRPGEPDFPDAGEHSANGTASDPDLSHSGDPSPDAGGEDSAAEPPVGEHPIVEEARETTEPAAVEDAPEAAGSEEPTTFYDQTSGGEPDPEPLDHEEPSGDELGEATSTEDSPPAVQDVEPAEPEGAAEPPVESLDTVEHPAPSDAIETEAPPAEEPEPEAEPDFEDEHSASEEEGPLEEEPEGDEEPDGEDSEDVLADTPEFLKDAPEDDELWFEQG